jgi:hypothetical protein
LEMDSLWPPAFFTVNTILHLRLLPRGRRKLDSTIQIIAILVFQRYTGVTVLWRSVAGAVRATSRDGLN